MSSACKASILGLTVAMTLLPGPAVSTAAGGSRTSTRSGLAPARLSPGLPVHPARLPPVPVGGALP